MVSKQLPVRTMERRRQQRPSRKFHQPPSLWQRLAPVAWFNLTHDRTRLMVGLAGVAFAVLLNFMNLGYWAPWPQRHSSPTLTWMLSYF